MHGPTAAERTLMDKWIKQFVAFVNNNQDYEFSTRAIDEMKVATPDGTLEIQNDQRFGEPGRIGRRICK
ncbi:hypothetical protein PENSUB_10935 [Penicillium subrubescens]|uniref:Uncharacterized protein n=2 Tax=Penicillium subrubescens TaxID=1316194 RepID=A0A1Q5T6R0_9EURO|nr:hypothetical protein PENSUB_10935 [Penicillium subrubescens]